MSGAVIPRSLTHIGQRILIQQSLITPGQSSVSRNKYSAESVLSSFGCHRNFTSRRNPISPVLEQSRCFLATSSQDRIFKVFQSSSSSTSKEEEAKNQNIESSPESSTVSAEEVAKLKETLAEIQSKHDDVLDKYRRAIAENDNMRKRLTKQIEDAKIFGIQSFVKDLLDVADVLNKAVSAGNEAGNNTSMLEGLKLTESQLLQVFKRHGLEQVNPLNEKFDPNKHEALFQIPNPNVDANTVLDVQKIGYQLRGRTIRPALVGVSKK